MQDRFFTDEELVAYLDGEHPAVVTQTGLYENEVFTAFDAKLHRLWQFKSVARR